jgi:hypothetical protein
MKEVRKDGQVLGDTELSLTFHVVGTDLKTLKPEGWETTPPL